jgi:hypothetical protein
MQARADRMSGASNDRRKIPTVDVMDRLAKILSVAISEFFVEPAKGSSPRKPLTRVRGFASETADFEIF